MYAVHALGHAIFHGPGNGIIAEAILAHVLKLRRILGVFWLAHAAPEEGNGLAAGTLAVGLKMRGIYAGGDALLGCPDHGIPVEAVVGHILEGLLFRCFIYAGVATASAGILIFSGGVVGGFHQYGLRIAVAQRRNSKLLGLAANGAGQYLLAVFRAGGFHCYTALIPHMLCQFTGSQIHLITANGAGEGVVPGFLTIPNGALAFYIAVGMVVKVDVFRIADVPILIIAGPLVLGAQIVDLHACAADVVHQLQYTAAHLSGDGDVSDPAAKRNCISRHVLQIAKVNADQLIAVIEHALWQCFHAVGNHDLFQLRSGKGIFADFRDVVSQLNLCQAAVFKCLSLDLRYRIRQGEGLQCRTIFEHAIADVFQLAPEGNRLQLIAVLEQIACGICNLLSDHSRGQLAAAVQRIHFKAFHAVGHHNTLNPGAAEHLRTDLFQAVRQRNGSQSLAAVKCIRLNLLERAGQLHTGYIRAPAKRIGAHFCDSFFDHNGLNLVSVIIPRDIAVIEAIPVHRPSSGNGHHAIHQTIAHILSAVAGVAGR